MHKEKHFCICGFYFDFYFHLISMKKTAGDFIRQKQSKKNTQKNTQVVNNKSQFNVK